MLTPALGRFTFGQLYHAIVFHGDLPDSVVSANMTAFRAAMGPELDRRARMLSEAINYGNRDDDSRGACNSARAYDEPDE